MEKGLLIPIIEYEVYNSDTKEKLDLTICNDIKIDISYSVSIDENNLYKYNISSDYYNDICYPYTTEDKTDIILNDRRNEFIENNMSLCENNCEFIEYDKETNKVECECSIKINFPLISEISINKDKLLKNFIDLKKTINISIIKCYKLVFSKEGLINNIGSYIILFIIILNIILLIIFRIKGYKKFIDRIKGIIKIVIAKRQNESKNINNIEKQAKSSEKTHKKQNMKINNPLIRKSAKSINNKSKHNITDDKLRKSSGNLSQSKVLINIKKKETINISIFQKNKKNKITIDQFMNKNINKNIANYNNDYELNNLSYKNAIKIDKRTYLQYYLSLLKTKHLLIFTFYTYTDYNSKIIKISLFLFCFSLYYTLNALFFTDSTLHKIYEDKGSFDFIYQIPQIIYSTIISSFISAIIKFLSLTQKNISEIKKEKNIKEKSTKALKCLNIKFILFYILLFLFLIIFWYYLSCFCAVYKNTQIYLIKDTLLSFILSLLYPFGLNLLPGIFRIPSLNGLKKNRECLYKLSKIIQII